MPRIRVSIALPYFLRLQTADYPTSASGEPVHLELPPLIEGTRAATVASAEFDHPDSSDPNEQSRLKTRSAEQLLRRVNHLLRWYRVRSGQAEVTELTLAQASPIQVRFWPVARPRCGTNR